MRGPAADGWKLRYAVDEKGDEDGGRRRRSARDILSELKREADRANRVRPVTLV